MVENRIRSKWHFSKENMLCMSQTKFLCMCFCCLGNVEYWSAVGYQSESSFLPLWAHDFRLLEARYQNQGCPVWKFSATSQRLVLLMAPLSLHSVQNQPKSLSKIIRPVKNFSWSEKRFLSSYEGVWLSWTYCCLVPKKPAWNRLIRSE